VPPYPIQDEHELPGRARPSLPHEGSRFDIDEQNAHAGGKMKGALDQDWRTGETGLIDDDQREANVFQ
jgi:hypothetical protein